MLKVYAYLQRVIHNLEQFCILGSMKNYFLCINFEMLQTINFWLYFNITGCEFYLK